MAEWNPDEAINWLRKKGLKPRQNIQYSVSFDVPALGKEPKQIAIPPKRSKIVTAYVNKYSITDVPFPVISGITKKEEYLKGSYGKNGNPGIAGSVARNPSLDPKHHDVLRVELANENSLAALFNWYSGNITDAEIITPKSPDASIYETAEEPELIKVSTQEEPLPLSMQKDYISSDIVDIINRNPESTTKEQLIQARLGQGKFRKNVIETWGLGECCAVTGISITPVLIASHIIPWRESDDVQRLNGTNGILLCSHLDKLFDQYLISFDTEGNLISSNRLSDHEWDQLNTIGIHKSLRLNTENLSIEDAREIAINLNEHQAKLKYNI